MASHANFISNERTAVVAFLEAMDTLRKYKRQWDTLGYSGNIVPGDLTGTNADLVAADIANFITSVQAIDDFCTNNFHWANLEKART